MRKSLLVTGGCGHIGSSLIRELSKDYSVTVVDDMTTQRYCSLFNMTRPIKFFRKGYSRLNRARSYGYRCCNTFGLHNGCNE